MEILRKQAVIYGQASSLMQGCVLWGPSINGCFIKFKFLLSLLCWGWNPGHQECQLSVQHLGRLKWRMKNCWRWSLRLHILGFRVAGTLQFWRWRCGSWVTSPTGQHRICINSECYMDPICLSKHFHVVECLEFNQMTSMYAPCIHVVQKWFHVFTRG